MVGTVIPKPVADFEQFRAAMAWCCDPTHGAIMLEYHDWYEIVQKPEAEPQQEVAFDEPVSLEQRVEEIEDALIDLAEYINEVANG